MSKPTIMIAIVAAVCAAGWLLTLRHDRRLRQRISELTGRMGHDDLTLLLNYTGLLERYNELTDRAANLMVFVIDLDRFRTVTGRFGHHTGDDVICEAATRIKEVTDIFGGFTARLFADRFVAVIEWRSHDINRVADLFARALARPIALNVDGQEVALVPSASVGAAWADSRDPLQEVALRRAAIAMHRAKRDGGDRYTVFVPGMAMPLLPAPPGQRAHDVDHSRLPLSPAEHACMHARRDVEVIVLVTQSHLPSRTAVFIDGQPAETAAGLRVRAQVFHLDPRDIDAHQEITRGLVRARTWSPAAGAYLITQLHQFAAAHQAGFGGSQG